MAISTRLWTESLMLAPEDLDQVKGARCRRAFMQFSQVAARCGLTQQETAIVAAQFLGLTIGQAPPSTHQAQLKVANSAARNALAQYLNRRTAP